MTLKEAGEAALANLPVVYESVFEGAILCARIGGIRKDFAPRSDVERGKPAATYSLELLPMNKARSVLCVDPEKVRLAEAADMRDVEQYREMQVMPKVHEELIIKEVRERR